MKKINFDNIAKKAEVSPNSTEIKIIKVYHFYKKEIETYPDVMVQGFTIGIGIIAIFLFSYGLLHIIDSTIHIDILGIITNTINSLLHYIVSMYDHHHYLF